MGMLL